MGHSGSFKCWGLTWAVTNDRVGNVSEIELEGGIRWTLKSTGSKYWKVTSKKAGFLMYPFMKLHAINTNIEYVNEQPFTNAGVRAVNDQFHKVPWSHWYNCSQWRYIEYVIMNVLCLSKMYDNCVDEGNLTTRVLKTVTEDIIILILCNLISVYAKVISPTPVTFS